MRLTLTSIEADGFDIKEDDTSHDGIQTVLPGAAANWYWNIMPKHSGQLHLRLIASIVVRSGGDERHQDFATFDNTITVSVFHAPEPSLGQRTWSAVAGFGSSNWKWLIGLFPLGEMTRRLSQRSKTTRAVAGFFSKKPAPDDNPPADRQTVADSKGPNEVLETTSGQPRA
jgi:hypothetical protein